MLACFLFSFFPFFPSFFLFFLSFSHLVLKTFFLLLLLFPCSPSPSSFMLLFLFLFLFFLISSEKSSKNYCLHSPPLYSLPLVPFSPTISFLCDYFERIPRTLPQHHPPPSSPHSVNVTLWSFLLPSSPFPSKRRGAVYLGFGCSSSPVWCFFFLVFF